MARWGIIAKEGRFEKRNYYCSKWYITIALDEIRNKQEVIEKKLDKDIAYQEEKKKENDDWKRYYVMEK